MNSFKLALTFLSVTIVGACLWKLSEFSTQKEIIRMTEKFVDEFRKYKNIESITEPTTVEISKKVKIRFSTVKEMKKNFLKTGENLMDVFEYAEVEKKEPKLKEELHQILHYLQYAE